jgi:hypothetical protein
MWDQHLENSTTKKIVQEKLSKIATSATGIPFSIFTETMCQHFGSNYYNSSNFK